jgi:ornithine carbamoyltransferase
VGDTARVLSRYIDIIAVRTDEQQKLVDMTASGSVPIINAMTNVGHPCQILADLLTLQEHFGDLTKKQISWIGDFHNMCLSWMEAAEKLGFTLRLSVPGAYQPDPSVLQQAAARGAQVEFFADPAEAADGADCVMTDVWVSLSQTDREPRLKAFRPFQVNEALMKRAKPTAVFLHCLPAHRGEEVTDGVIDGPQSLAWDQAENRMHAQKAVLRWCLGL